MTQKENVSFIQYHFFFLKSEVEEKIIELLSFKEKFQFAFTFSTHACKNLKMQMSVQLKESA